MEHIIGRFQAHNLRSSRGTLQLRPRKSFQGTHLVCIGSDLACMGVDLGQAICNVTETWQGFNDLKAMVGSSAHK